MFYFWLFFSIINWQLTILVVVSGVFIVFYLAITYIFDFKCFVYNYRQPVQNKKDDKLKVLLTITMEKFHGKNQDVDDWLCEFEKYLSLMKHDKEEPKIRSFIMLLDKNVKNQWFNKLAVKDKTNWHDLKKAMLEKFGEVKIIFESTKNKTNAAQTEQDGKIESVSEIAENMIQKNKSTLNSILKTTKRQNNTMNISTKKKKVRINVQTSIKHRSFEKKHFIKQIKQQHPKQICVPLGKNEPVVFKMLNKMRIPNMWDKKIS